MLFQSHKDKIYPWVKAIFTDDTDRVSNEIEVYGDDEPIFKVWMGDLAIFYAIDMGNDFRLLQRRDLPTSVSTQELHQIAINNLERDVEYKLNPTSFGGYGLLAGGDHEAGAITLKGVWAWLGDYFGENLLVGVPAKDLLFIVPESDTDSISNMKIFIYQCFNEGERLLTRNIFKYSKDSETWEIVDNVN